MADYLNIAGRIRTTASDGVAMEAQEVKDLNLNKSQQEVNADVQNDLGDRYTKEETYSKEQVNDLITTPDVNRVYVIATNLTTAVTDLLPATGSSDTLYNVGNWDGTQYDTTVYSIYGWDGTAYVCLAVRSFIGEVYDISANHPDGQGNPTPYADLSAALGTDGANIPADIRRGGMSIKFIQGTVQSSDNKYVQYRLMADSFTTDITKWQNMGDFVEEKEHPIADNEVAGYLTDKNKSIIAKLMKSGAVEWLVKNSDITALETAISDEQTRAEEAEGNLLDALIEFDAKTVKEVSTSTAEENVASYLTDKGGKILLRIMSNGALEKTVKNSTDIRFESIEELLSYVSSEVPDSGNGVIKYLTDKDGKVIATINNVGETEFKGGGGFGGEITKSRIVGFDAVKVLTDNKGSVIGYIDSKGGVYFYNLLNQDKNQAKINSINFIMNTVSNSGKNKSSLNILNNLPKESFSFIGYSYETVPFISFHDDDAIDDQIPVSLSYEATPETRVSATSKGTGFASFLYVFMKSITERHKTDIKGKLVFDLAAEGQRIGLLDKVYSDNDTFDGKLNFSGEMARKLHTRCGWGIMCHTMTARYIHNSYWVNSLNDPLVTQIVAAATKNVQNSWKNSYIHCEDTNLDYEYRIDDNNHGEWHLVSDHYLRPYLAKSLDANAPLYFNPRYSTYYQFGEWKKRAQIAGLPFIDAIVYPGSSPCREHIIESMEYFKDVILGQQEHINEQPLNQTCIRRFHYHPSGNNAWSDSKYNALIQKVDECVEDKSWLILTSHANDVLNKNYYIDGVDYGDRRDDNYPSEWIVPLRQGELESIDENNYWEVPPARLGISSWAEWYPCPGTTYDMLLNVIEYAISKGVEFGSTEEGISRFGNKFMIGLKYPEKTNADTRLALTERKQGIYNYIIEKNDGSIEYKVQ